MAAMSTRFNGARRKAHLLLVCRERSRSSSETRPRTPSPTPAGYGTCGSTRPAEERRHILACGCLGYAVFLGLWPESSCLWLTRPGFGVWEMTMEKCLAPRAVGHSQCDCLRACAWCGEQGHRLGPQTSSNSLPKRADLTAAEHRGDELSTLRHGGAELGTPTHGGAELGTPRHRGADPGIPMHGGAELGTPRHRGAELGTPKHGGAELGTPTHGGADPGTLRDSGGG